MPARNIHHDLVVQALTIDGWTITDNPLRLTYGQRDLYVDLGAEASHTVGAERSGEKIAVEIQSFLSTSPMRDLEEALGQFQVYRAVMAESQPDRKLFMAVPTRAYDGVLSEQLGQLIIDKL